MSQPDALTQALLGLVLAKDHRLKDMTHGRLVIEFAEKRLTWSELTEREQHRQPGGPQR